MPSRSFSILDEYSPPRSTHSIEKWLMCSDSKAFQHITELLTVNWDQCYKIKESLTDIISKLQTDNAFECEYKKEAISDFRKVVKCFLFTKGEEDDRSNYRLWTFHQERVEETQPIPVTYVDYANISLFLGSNGIFVLNKILTLIQQQSIANSLPITNINVTLESDSELAKWQYVAILLLVNCVPEKCDELLHYFYTELEILGKSLDGDYKKIFLKDFFIDTTCTTLSSN